MMSDRASDDAARRGAAIDVDLMCVDCGYNLRTLTLSAHCPECGDAVMATLGAWRGPPAPVETVRSMIQQATALIWTPVAAFFAVIVGGCLGGPGLAVFVVVMATFIHVGCSGSITASATKILKIRENRFFGLTALGLLVLGLVPSLVIGRFASAFWMLPAMITWSSLSGTRAASRLAGAAGPEELATFGGAVFQLTAAVLAISAIVFFHMLLDAMGILTFDNEGVMIGVILLSIASVIVLIVWMVFHMILMVRLKRWLTHAEIGLAYFSSANQNQSGNSSGAEAQ